MTRERLLIDDYPLAENRPELVRGKRGRPLSQITLAEILSGTVDMEDLRITAETLRRQAAIARAAGRERLALNFERAAEMTNIPQDEIMEIYELLRPGRARDRETLLSAGERLRRHHDAPLLAALLEEAAEVYHRRGLYNFRY